MAHNFMTQNKIPDLMPISTLVCPPSHTFTKQYLSDGYNTVQPQNPNIINNIQSARTPNLMVLPQQRIASSLAGGKETTRASTGLDMMN